MFLQRVFLLSFFLLPLISFGQSDTVNTGIICPIPDQYAEINMDSIRKCVVHPAVGCRAGEPAMSDLVIISCIVMPDGTVREKQVVKGKDPKLSKIALDAIDCAQPFTPAKKAGRPVACKMMIPVRFTFQ